MASIYRFAKILNMSEKNIKPKKSLFAKKEKKNTVSDIEMDTISTENKTTKKKKFSKSALILIIGILIIAIPVAAFGSILVISYLQTSTPRNGDRFKGDLVNEITKEDCKTLQTSFEGITSVEKVEVNVAQGQLKVFIDIKDTATEQETDSIIEKAYSIVTSKLPVNKYFTTSSTNKNYDLAIHVYTTLKAAESETSSRQYKILHKNAAEEDFSIDDVAHAKNPDLAKELREDND